MDIYFKITKKSIKDILKDFTMNPADDSISNPKKDNNSPKQWKLGHRLIFYGLYGCINCAFLLPLLSHADRTNMFDKVEEIDYDTKEKYKEKIGGILDKYGLLQKNPPSPIILFQREKDKVTFLVKPDTVSECAVELMDALNQLGDTAVLQYMDGELDHKILFNNLLLKLTTNIIFPKDYKKSNNTETK